MGFCRFFKPIVAAILIGSLSSISQAVTRLPMQLDHDDQNRALEILGFGSTAKTLDNPYPLGGYSGVEIGISSEFIPVDDLSTLGDGTGDDGEYSYYTVSIGKGLYYNIDVMVYATPFVQDEDISSFGGQIRWGFYEAQFFPLSLTALAYAGGANFSNLINVTTQGFDLIGTVNVENIAIYAGYGKGRAIGNFVGGANGITADQQSRQIDLLEDHTMFGVNINIQKMFVALEINRYIESTYAGKIGFRF
jgi:hypothetical protein